MTSQQVLAPDILAQIDAECRGLVLAMNRLDGIRTFESCCGHGRSEFRIWFAAASLDDLPAICYLVHSCHCGVRGWEVVARTDCAMQPITFMLRSASIGQAAYAEADTIAEVINRWVDTAAEAEA